MEKSKWNSWRGNRAASRTPATPVCFQVPIKRHLELGLPVAHPRRWGSMPLPWVGEHSLGLHCRPPQGSKSTHPHWTPCFSTTTPRLLPRWGNLWASCQEATANAACVAFRLCHTTRARQEKAICPFLHQPGRNIHRQVGVLQEAPYWSWGQDRPGSAFHLVNIPTGRCPNCRRTTWHVSSK